MAKIKIGGKVVTIDDVFLEMTPEEQDAVVEDIFADMQANASGPPAGAEPGTREYADWAAEQARAGNELPQISESPEPDSSILDPFVQGTTFGFADELRGVVQGGIAAAQGGDFEDTRRRVTDESRNALDRERRVNPIGSVAAEVAGAIPTGLMAGGQLAGRGASLWARMGSGALVGGAQGAVYGSGAAGDSAEERGKGAAFGGAAGAALGGAVPALAAGASAGYRNVVNRLSANSASRDMGLQPESARFLQATMSADDALGPAGLRRMQAAGREAMPVDAGQSAVNTLDHAIQSSGQAGRIATDRIGGRVSRDAEAIQQALDDALGAPQGVQTTRAAIRQDSAGARSAAYDEAYNTPIDYSSPQGRRLDELLSRVDQADINAANRLMRAEGLQSKSIMASIADDGTVTFQRKPDVQQIDYITRALNDRSAANAGLGKMGGQTNEGRVFGNLSRDIRGTTKEAVPEYATALETAADPLRRSQAVEFGADLLRPSTTREQVADQVAGMTQPELDAMAQGVRSHIDDTLANVTRAITDGDMPAREAVKALRDLSTRASREKIGMVVGEERAAALFSEIDRATQSFELRAGVASNSKTFQRQEMNRRLTDMTEPDGMVSNALRGEPINALKRGVQTLTGQTPTRALARRDAINTEVVDFLTTQGPQGLQRMNALSRLNNQTGRQSQRSITLRDSLQRGGAGAVPYLGGRVGEAMATP